MWDNMSIWMMVRRNRYLRMDRRATDAVNGRVFARDPIAPDFVHGYAKDTNSDQKFRRKKR